MERMKALGMVAGALVIGVAGLTGCSDDDGGDAAADRPGRSAGAPAEPGADAPAESGADAPAAEEASAVPSPDPAQTADLLKRLGEIHPALATERDKAVSRARNVCDDARWSEGDDAGVNARAADRFSGGGTPALTPEQGARIVTAVRETFCP
ncbi:DUF732 domain-containing protein [Streptomyces pactum]|uniref:DUF732 domain-containing protein n=1 Tax=Streptomyces pactum TaxID=68249 RepID=UPI0036FE57F4